MNRRLDLETLINSSGATCVAVAYYDLASREEILINQDLPFHAASTMKVCVMMELFRQAATGRLTLEETIEVRNEFKSIVDGSSYSIDREDDSYPSLYERVGEKATLIDLCEPMITHSSNLATNLLIDRLGARDVDAFMQVLGAKGLHVLRGVEDGKAYRAGLNNIATARGLTQILTRLARNEVVSAQASHQMVSILRRQQHRRGIPAGLPIDCNVANKTGWNNLACHDTAIVETPNQGSYVLTVLTTGLDEKTTGLDLIASISRLICGKTRA